MFKILIVDDEAGAREKIKRLLSSVKEALQIEEACNGIEAIEKINNLTPDLIFLDIQMPGLNGFDVLCHFPDRDFNVVFQTAYGEFAVKAFEENAIDYLLKPIDRKRFEKFWDRFVSNRKPNSTQVIRDLHQSGIDLQKISVKVGQSIRVIHIDSIFFFKSVDRFVRLYLEDKDYSCDLTLEQLEDKLGSNFIRVHRACLVNINHVHSVIVTTTSTKIRMTNGEEVDVSRSNRKMVKELFDIKKAK